MSMIFWFAKQVLVALLVEAVSWAVTRGARLALGWAEKHWHIMVAKPANL